MLSCPSVPALTLMRPYSSAVPQVFQSAAHMADSYYWYTYLQVMRVRGGGGRGGETEEGIYLVERHLGCGG